MTAEVNRCERCGDPYEPTQETQRYCSGRCREAAKKRRSRLRPLGAKLPGTTGDTGDTSLMGEPETDADWYESLRPLSDHDATDERVRRMLNIPVEDVATTARRGLWSYWKDYGKRTGVQPQAQVDDRVARRRAAEAETLERITSAPGQVENRLNPVTRNVVAEAGMASRKLNSHKRRADDMPRDMQQSIYQPRMALPANVGGRAGSRDYAWQMIDGF